MSVTNEGSRLLEKTDEKTSHRRLPESAGKSLMEQEIPKNEITSFNRKMEELELEVKKKSDANVGNGPVFNKQ